MQSALFTEKAAAAAGFHKIRGGAAQKAIFGGTKLIARSRISFDRKATFGGTKLIGRCNNNNNNNNNNNTDDVGEQTGGGYRMNIEAEIELLGLFPLVKYRGQFDALEDKVSVRFLGIPAFSYLVKKDAASTKLAKDFWALTKGFWALVIFVWALRQGRGFWALIIVVLGLLGLSKWKVSSTGKVELSHQKVALMEELMNITLASD